jgi:hypothetical protein
LDPLDRRAQLRREGLLREPALAADFGDAPPYVAHQFVRIVASHHRGRSRRGPDTKTK